MTEDEAKTKWCPFARVDVSVRSVDSHLIVNIAGGGNRMLDGNQRREDGGQFHENPIQARCIGSACMAWRRWYFEPGPGEREGRDGGFCGLAGRPT